MKEHNKLAENIQGFLESHHERIIHFLKDLVSLESPSNEIESQHKILNFLKFKFEDIGYRVILVPGKKNWWVFVCQTQRKG